jgi:hypothetical protein
MAGVDIGRWRAMGGASLFAGAANAPAHMHHRHMQRLPCLPAHRCYAPSINAARFYMARQACSLAYNAASRGFWAKVAGSGRQWAMDIGVWFVVPPSRDGRRNETGRHEELRRNLYQRFSLSPYRQQRPAISVKTGVGKYRQAII